MNFENILAVFGGFVITIILYLVIIKCMNEYRWCKLKLHVIEAIEELNLWDKVNAIDINGAEFLSIAKFLDAHKYKHCFYGNAGAFKLYYMLAEIRNDHERT